jgi:hypothetical protein
MRKEDSATVGFVLFCIVFCHTYKYAPYFYLHGYIRTFLVLPPCTVLCPVGSIGVSRHLCVSMRVVSMRGVTVRDAHVCPHHGFGAATLPCATTRQMCFNSGSCATQLWGFLPPCYVLLSVCRILGRGRPGASSPPGGFLSCFHACVSLRHTTARDRGEPWHDLLAAA